MRKKVVIRCDAGPTIGLGHLIRSIALAHMLKSDFDIHFVNREIPSSVKYDLITFGFHQSTIFSEEDLFHQITKDDIVVLDHYGLGAEFQLKVKQNGNPLVCIDDLHNKDFYADLIINHAPGAAQSWYRAQDYSKYALGLAHVLLRPAFIKVAQHKRPIHQLENILICFGGADTPNLTYKTLSAAIRTHLFKNINIIIGTSYLGIALLSELVESSANVHLYSNVNEQEMIRIMKNSDLAIVPSSGILFEALACGCEVISGFYVDNQQEIYQGFKDLDMIHPAENFSDIEALLTNSPNFSLKNNKNLIDGLSGQRLLKCFQDL